MYIRIDADLMVVPADGGFNFREELSLEALSGQERVVVELRQRTTDVAKDKPRSSLPQSRTGREVLISLLSGTAGAVITAVAEILGRLT